MRVKSMSKLQAGNELDTIIATKVMGWRRLSWHDYHATLGIRDARTTTLTYGWHTATGEMVDNRAEDCDDYYCPEAAWSPSTNIAAAWQVVEKLGNWHGFDFRLWLEYDANGQWQAGWFENGYDGLESRCSAMAGTAPLAVCRAALKAIDGS